MKCPKCGANVEWIPRNQEYDEIVRCVTTEECGWAMERTGFTSSSAWWKARSAEYSAMIAEWCTTMPDFPVEEV